MAAALGLGVVAAIALTVMWKGESSDSGSESVRYGVGEADIRRQADTLIPASGLASKAAVDQVGDTDSGLIKFDRDVMRQVHENENGAAEDASDLRPAGVLPTQTHNPEDNVAEIVAKAVTEAAPDGLAVENSVREITTAADSSAGELNDSEEAPAGGPAGERVDGRAGERVIVAAPEQVRLPVDDELTVDKADGATDGLASGPEDGFADGSVEAQVAPEVAPELAPEVAPELAPAVVEDGAPEFVPELAPAVVEEGATEIVPELAPALVEEGTPELAPAVLKEGAPEVVSEVVPEGVPAVVEEDVPEGVPEGAPAGVPAGVPAVVRAVVPTIEAASEVASVIDSEKASSKADFEAAVQQSTQAPASLSEKARLLVNQDKAWNDVHVVPFNSGPVPTDQETKVGGYLSLIRALEAPVAPGSVFSGELARKLMVAIESSRVAFKANAQGSGPQADIYNKVMDSLAPYTNGADNAASAARDGALSHNNVNQRVARGGGVSAHSSRHPAKARRGSKGVHKHWSDTSHSGAKPYLLTEQRSSASTQHHTSGGDGYRTSANIAFLSFVVASLTAAMAS
jgi:hypothetical protein